MLKTPQVEDGFTRIANTLLEALARYRIPGEPRQIFDAIIRMTFGYNRTWHVMTLADFQAMTGLKKPKICNVIKMLITSQLIVIKNDNDNNVSYRIQKDYTKWKVLSKKITNPNGRPLSKMITQINLNDNESLSKKITNVNYNDNATPCKPLPGVNLQGPKDNLKTKERKLKERKPFIVNNSKKSGLQKAGELIKIPDPPEPETEDLEPF